MLSLLWSWLLLLGCCVFSIAHADTPQFEFGTIPAEDCPETNGTVSCTITFENTYTEAPLVFVMSTIDASRSNWDTNPKETEYPSDLRIMSVGTESASVEQLLPSYDAACDEIGLNNADQWRCRAGIDVTYQPAPMSDIDYFVIEPGVIEFDNGAKIVAGTVSSNLTYSNSNSSGGSNQRLTVDFSDYDENSSDFTSDPGVLVQIQSINNQVNNQPLWLTAIAYQPDEDGFDLILDRSEVTPNAPNNRPMASESVAFVAGLGEGFVNGRKFWLGQGSTQNTLNSDDRLIEPITEGCTQVSEFTAEGFNSVPILLASKRTRNGNNGGWLRRCSVSTTGVALINEEDMHQDYERGHVVEPFSYFLFEKPPLDEVCELFPSPAQTWVGNDEQLLSMSNTTQIIGTQLINGQRVVGFNDDKIEIKNKANCDGQDCIGDAGLMVEKQELESFRTSDVVVDLSNADEAFELKNDDVLQQLRVGKNSTAIFYSGTYWVADIEVHNAGIIEIPDGETVTIHTKTLKMSQGTSFKEIGSGQLIVLVHGVSDDIQVDFNNTSEFTGLLYSEAKVKLSNSSIVRGAITAKSLEMANSSQLIATDNHCFQPADDYEITISPPTNLALMCGDDKPTFDITATNNNLPISTNIVIELYKTTSGDSDYLTTELGGNGSKSGEVYSTNDEGLLTVAVSVEESGISQVELNEDYTITATLNAAGIDPVSATFKYVPFKIAIDDQEVIAGKPYQVDAKVLACDESGNELTATNYQGSPTITHSVTQPSGGDNGRLDYAPTFSSGEAKEADLSINESGVFLVTLTDDDFDCTGYDDCPIEGDDADRVLTGSFEVKSRPWTFALCPLPDTGTDMSGTSSSGVDFSASGVPFDLAVLPIVWHEGSETAEIESQNSYCQAQWVTQNFYHDNAPATTLMMTHEVETPSANSGGINGTLTGNDDRLNTATANDSVYGEYYDYSGLVWDEVGSVRLRVGAENDYLGMTINPGFRGIGRFYPAFFSIDSVKWTSPSNQGDVTYMDQNFEGLEIIVNAYSGDVNNPSTATLVNNYYLFSAAYQAEFELKDDSINDGRIELDLSVGYWQSDGQSGSQWSVDFDSNDEVSWLRSISSDPPLKTEADGPFNTDDSGSSMTDLGLTISAPDSANFDNGQTSQVFPQASSNLLNVQYGQPPVRYGRMRLFDVGGSAGETLKIPLTVEFWNGNQFVTNSDDNASQFDTDNYCSEWIWSEDSDSSAFLTNSDDSTSISTVVSGQSDAVLAKQDPMLAQREQVRIYLRQGNSNHSNLDCLWDQGYGAQPWLIYNWQGNGDEDPSALVTFGIFRGNDKIIFRGEDGLTGQ
ncbi:hypothetical protein BCU68_07235 [Vibrio sp. 10N.286.49.B3]|nr:hypothetical protein BCU68_07235 [Vibrio sp. 10N.286.49.B3]